MGLLDDGPDVVADRLELAWSAFLDVARSAELVAPSRLPRWTGHDVLVHLGDWGEDPTQRIVDAARTGHRTGRRRDGADRNKVDPNDVLVEAHRAASRDDVLAALELHRDRMLRFLGTDEAATLARATTESPIGPLPLLTVLGASAYELAVHALDLAPCGAQRPAPQLLHAGLGAVLDVTGQLATAKRHRIDVTAMSPDGGWRVRADPDGWTVDAVPAGPLRTTGVRAELADLVDATAGRQAVPVLIGSRRMTAHDLPGFLRLAALVEDVPGLPGGPALRAAARTLGLASGVASGVAGALRRLAGGR